MIWRAARDCWNVKALHSASCSNSAGTRSRKVQLQGLRRPAEMHTSSGPTADWSGRRWWLAATLTTSGLGTLWASEVDPAHIKELGAAVPRFMWAIGWGARASWQYRQCLNQHQGSEQYDEALEATHIACARRLQHLCESNGGVYVKAAQLLSTAQSLPAPYRRELETLQDRVQPRPVAHIHAVIEQELGCAASDAYAAFEEDAKAAASLAQVHRARLHDGREVAVKVQYPGLQAAVTADLAALASLASAAAVLFPNAFDFGWVISELQTSLGQELDFSREASNAVSLARRMRHRSYVTVPAPVPELSTSRVITMEWIDGCKVNDTAQLTAKSLRPREVALLLLHTFAEMTFVHGCCHADPHPGNIIVRPSPHPAGRLVRWLRGGWRQPQLVLLDHGLYCTMPEHLRMAYCRLWCSFVTNDMSTAVAMATELAGQQGGEILPTLLKPGTLSKMSPEERQKLRDRLGISSPADFGRLLQLLPHELIDFMRITSIVRGIAAGLGGTVHDRMRINATYALHGMAWQTDQGSRRMLAGGVRERAKRLQIGATIYCLRMGFWLVSCADAVWEGIWTHVLRRRVACRINDSDSLVPSGAQ